MGHDFKPIVHNFDIGEIKGLRRVHPWLSNNMGSVLAFKDGCHDAFGMPGNAKGNVPFGQCSSDLLRCVPGISRIKGGW
jgi:hypothetical protein